jgi:2-alkyl-3-oxoalkanoate reductase
LAGTIPNGTPLLVSLYLLSNLTFLLRVFMKVLITGGGGFLGRSLAIKLLELGYEVTILGRHFYPQLQKKFPCIKANVRDRSVLIKSIEGQEVVFHTAATPGIWGDYDDFYKTDVHGTKNIILACQKNKVKKLIYTSSPSVIFGKNDLEGVDEKTPYPDNYLCHYAKTKAIAEKMVIDANSYEGLATVCIRPHLIWGPGDPHLLPRIVKRAKSNKLIQVGEGKNLVDMIYIDNAVEAHIKVFEKLEVTSNVAGKCYFVSDDNPIILWDWIELLLIKLNLPTISKKISFKYAFFLGQILEFFYKIFHIKKEPLMTRFLATQLGKSHYFDITQSKKDFGYKPIVTNEEGIRRLVKDYYSRQEH